MRHRDGYLHAQFLRLKSRRGPKKAILAVAASMLSGMFFILRDQVDYRDLGGDRVLHCGHRSKQLRPNA